MSEPTEPTEEAQQWTPELLAEFHDLTEAVDPEYNPWYFFYCPDYTPPNEKGEEKSTDGVPKYKAGNPLLTIRSYTLHDLEEFDPFEEDDPLAHVFYTPAGPVLEFETFNSRGKITHPDGTTTTIYGTEEALKAAGATSIQYLD